MASAHAIVKDINDFSKAKLIYINTVAMPFDNFTINFRLVSVVKKYGNKKIIFLLPYFIQPAIHQTFICDPSENQNGHTQGFL